MVDAAILVTAAANAIAAAVFGLVGYRFLRDRFSDGARPAARGFATWWWGLAIVTLVTLFAQVQVAFDAVDLIVMETMMDLLIAATCVSLWGLAIYLLYLWTGRVRTRGLLEAAVVLYYVAFAYVWNLTGGITTIQPNGWGITYELAYRPEAYALLYAVLTLPFLALPVGYAAVALTVKDRTARVRVIATAILVVLWIFALVLQFDSPAAQTLPLPVLLTSATAVWAGFVYLTFYPTGWAQRRLGLTTGGFGAPAKGQPAAAGSR